MSETKKNIAVFFGGQSPEHDVSIITGLQVVSALDTEKYTPIPVYVSFDGKWWIGEGLENRDFYIPSASDFNKLHQVYLGKENSQHQLIEQTDKLLGKRKKWNIDAVIPAFHGKNGEDGCFQGLFELSATPYTGMRVMAASVLMDKAGTKNFLSKTGIPLLPHAHLKKPKEGLLIPEDVLNEKLQGMTFPLILKPAHLGSSIGVAKVNNTDEILATLPEIFKYDNEAILEPFIENMVEYNVAVSGVTGETTTSAIEKPKTQEELLDFSEKYCAGGTKGEGTKTPGQTQASEGMLSLTREINPDLPEELENNIRQWSKTAFEAIGGTGAPRIDYISDKITGEIWLNEINPCPGSFGYFLWEALDEPIIFSELLDYMIQEAFTCNMNKNTNADPTPDYARLLPRK